MEIIRIPEWAEKLLVDQRCPFCQRPYTVDDVSASGNRRKYGQVFYFYEVECSKCKNPAMSIVKSRPCDSAQLGLWYIEFAKAMLDGSDNGRNTQDTPSLEPKNLITDDEVRMLQELLRNCSDHLAFLEQIGMSAKDIKKYARPRK